MGPVPVDVHANALARHLAVPPGALRAASLRKQSFLRRIRTGARAYALAPWGMQPNTSHDESPVLYHLSSESAYYTIFRNSAVTWLEEIFAPAASRSKRTFIVRLPSVKIGYC